MQVTHHPNKITVHCSATKNGERHDIEYIRSDHIHNRGWDDVGYHGVIQPNGEWQAGRALNIVGSHVKDHNTGNIGLCLIGTDRFTKEQFYKLYDKIREIQRCLNIYQWEVYTHAQFDTAIAQGKTCPNIRPNDLLYFISTEDCRPIKKYMLEDS